MYAQRNLRFGFCVKRQCSSRRQTKKQNKNPDPRWKFGLVYVSQNKPECMIGNAYRANGQTAPAQLQWGTASRYIESGGTKLRHSIAYIHE